MSIFRIGGDNAAVLAALDKSQAIIEFKMDGTILTANENFLKALGYTLDEIQRPSSQHLCRRILPPKPGLPRSSGHALNRGEYQAAEYKRIGKGGKEVWIRSFVQSHPGLPKACRSRS